MKRRGDVQAISSRTISVAGVAPLPAFFIVGPPRTGTSWLHSVLGEHAILPVSTKETGFFDRRFRSGLAWYQRHYPQQVDHHVVGEVAPTYFSSSEAREHIARLIPAAKIVCIFRNPADRVLSLYRLKCAYGRYRWNFQQAMVRDDELINSSRYATHLKAWRNTFGAGQILATVYDDLCNAPQQFLDGVVDFIGVRRFPLNPAQIRFVYASEGMTHPRSYHRTRGATVIADWLKGRGLNGVVSLVNNSAFRRFFLGGGPPFAELSGDVRAWLCNLFRPEIEELEELLNRDLSAWKSQNAFSQPNPTAA